MFPLLETAVGFVAVMLLLSLLVKSLTSLVKDQFDFYSDNLKYEASRFVRNTIGRSWSELQEDPAIVKNAPWLKDIDWSRVGTEFFNKENVDWLLKGLGASPAQLENVEGRLAVHLSRVKYMFEQRMKNLSIAIGIGLCLVLDVNALTIWHTLYTHDQLRTTFASEVATRALLESKDAASQAEPTKDPDVEQQRQNLKQASAKFSQGLATFTTEVSFGVGKVWKEDMTSRRALAIEFMGALLTGILISVGAPYWHDLLESLSSLRKPK